MEPSPLFPVGTLAGADDVVDRQEFMADVTAQLASGQSLVVAGPRRIGKTSVSREILRRLAHDGFYTAYVDLFLATSQESLATHLTQSILENHVGLRNRAVHTWADLREWARSLTLTGRLAGMDILLSHASMDPSPDQMLDEALNLAERIADRDNRRCIILFDEFQELDRIGGTPVFQRLRAILQRQTRCTYLFLGSQASLLYALFADRRQALYRFALLLDLPPIPAAAWSAYLARKFHDVGMRTSDVAVAELLRQTGGHPYGLMQVANRTYLAAMSSGRGEVTAELVASAYEDVLRMLGRVYEAEWADLRRVKYADRVLTAIVRGEAPYGGDLAAVQVHRALQALQERGILNRGKPRGHYTLWEPMFGDWIARRLG
jgi:hypothetical protein